MPTTRQVVEPGHDRPSNSPIRLDGVELAQVFPPVFVHKISGASVWPFPALPPICSPTASHLDEVKQATSSSPQMPVGNGWAVQCLPPSTVARMIGACGGLVVEPGQPCPTQLTRAVPPLSVDLGDAR